jgi:hypothetical protein
MLIFFKYLFRLPEYYLKKKNSSLIILCIIWCHSLLVTSCPLFGWNRYIQEAFGTSCTIDWLSMLPSSQAYNILIIVTCYCVHICILIFCYFNIIRTFDISANEISALRQADIVDEQTLNLELILKYHKIMTHRKVTMVSTIFRKTQAVDTSRCSMILFVRRGNQNPYTVSKRNRQHNDQKKKYKRTNNDHLHIKLKIE